MACEVLLLQIAGGEVLGEQDQGDGDELAFSPGRRSAAAEGRRPAIFGCVGADELLLGEGWRAAIGWGGW